jgi:hypothetical protein
MDEMNQERSEREEWGDEGWEFDQLSADLSTALARIDELKGDLRELRENILLGLGMTAEDVAEMDDDSMEPSIAFLLSGHQEVVAQLAALKAAGEWRPVTETDPPNGPWVQVGWPDGNISKAHRYDEDTWINTDGLKFQFVPGKNPMFRYLPTPPKGNQ